MALKYAYYPGCSLHSMGSEYDSSFRAVCEKLSLNIAEVEGWICCGTTPAHCTSKLLSLALPMQNLCAVEKMGMDKVVAPCASCFSRLKAAQHEAAADATLERQLAEVLDAPLPSSVQVVSPLEMILTNVDFSAVSRESLDHLKVVCYYGCLLTRPPKVMDFDECEYPMSMDTLLRSLGITTLDWSFKTDCCGGAVSATETDIVLKLTHDILEEARAVGANAIAVACPLCHTNLDTRQAAVEQKYDTHFDLPIFYFTQLMGLALGIPAETLGLQKHFVCTSTVLQGMGQTIHA
jgi:heterodisulfide reductase subunit B2